MTTLIIIAEFGSSIIASLDFDRWCRTAAECGATHAKAQLFLADHFPEAEQASKRPLEFPRARLGEFVQVAHHYGLKAGASVFDPVAVRIVADQCDFIKLAAREQVNISLLALVLLAYDATGKSIYRSIDSLGGIAFPDLITTLIAVPEYPAPLMLSLITLYRFARRMKRMGVTWGYSSHTTHASDCIIAARLGASVIEKHLALSESDIEVGHSLLPDQFKRMVERITK